MWSWDFIHDRTSDGNVLKMLTLIDEYSRECLKIEVKDGRQTACQGAPIWKQADRGQLRHQPEDPGPD